MSKESARGHAKNARNQLKDMIILKRRGDEISQESVEYALDEVKEVLEEL